MSKYYRLTTPTDAEFCYELANRINKDYPGQAVVERQSSFYVVLITSEHWDYCRGYVQRRCKIREEN